MSGLGGLWESLVDAVCRPPRDSDYTDEELIGGKKAVFTWQGGRYYRQDLQLENVRGEKLACSHFRPCIVGSKDGRLPAVIYCHCNSGSRRDAEEIVFHFLPKHVTVFSLDFAGSGRSQGSWVTLGAREVDDLEAAVTYLRGEGAALTIGLWGRSMGSVASLLYAGRDPSIAGLVLDSPFSRLRDLMMELGSGSKEGGLRMPRPLARVALSVLKRSVRRKAGFSIDAVAPLDIVPGCHCPALFGHAQGDDFVSPWHAERLAAAYGGEARLRLFQGDHNSARPEEWYEDAVLFMLRALRVQELLGFDPVLTDAATLRRAIAAASRGRRGGAAGAGVGPASPTTLRALPVVAEGPGGTDAGSEGANGGLDTDSSPGRSSREEDEDMELQAVLELSLLESRNPGASSGDRKTTDSNDDEAQLARALQLSLLDAPNNESKPETGPCPACGEAQDAEAELLRRVSTPEADNDSDGAGKAPPSPLALARQSVALHAGQEQQAVQAALQAAGGTTSTSHGSPQTWRQS